MNPGAVDGCMGSIAIRTPRIMSNSEHSHASRPRVPSYSLSRQIEHGGRAEAWLACHADGEFRAVSVVRRSQCQDDKAFDQEWRRVLGHDLVSGMHDAWLGLLSCDRNEEQ